MSRGRPAQDRGEQSIQMSTLMEQQQAAQKRLKRDGRINLAPKSKLDWANKEEGYHYEWASNSETYPVKLQDMFNAGYTMVTHDAGQNSGEPVIMNSKGCNLVLVRIPLEYYLEDEKVKQDKSLRQVREINNQVGEREYAGDSKELGRGKVATHEAKAESPDAIDLMGD